MQEILNQLGELVLGSVPTIVFFFILLAGYSVLVRKPLAKVLADRHSRTGGAMDDARKAIAAAETKTGEYERKLREAKGMIFESRQARQKAAADAREKALAETREAAKHRIDVAREGLERSADEAKTQIEAGAAALSQQILAAILPSRGAGAAR